MKQVQLNIFLSAILLGLVFVVASFSTPQTSAFHTEVPAITIGSISGGQLRLHGSGFRPGSLVSLKLQNRAPGAAPVAVARTWVDMSGGFVAELDVTRLSRDQVPLWDDFVVLATASSASVSVPVAPAELRQY